MKDLGALKKIFDMSIISDRYGGTRKLSIKKYIEKVLEKFGLQDGKIRSMHLGCHFNFTKKQSPQTDEDKRYG